MRQGAAAPGARLARGEGPGSASPARAASQGAPLPQVRRATGALPRRRPAKRVSEDMLATLATPPLRSPCIPQRSGCHSSRFRAHNCCPAIPTSPGAQSSRFPPDTLAGACWLSELITHVGCLYMNRPEL